MSNRHNADNVGERDFLRTEGDPGAVGYTIKEAVQLTRSVVSKHHTLFLNYFESNNIKVWLPHINRNYYLIIVAVLSIC